MFRKLENITKKKALFLPQIILTVFCRRFLLVRNIGYSGILFSKNFYDIETSELTCNTN